MSNENQTVQSVTAYCQFSLGIIDHTSVALLRAIAVATSRHETPDPAKCDALAALEGQCAAFQQVLAQLNSHVDPATIVLPPEVT